jgi:hypothetical protein
VEQMKKCEIIEMMETIVKYNKNVFSNDKAAIRTEFHNVKDNLHRNNQITDNQVQNWILTDRELNKLLKISRG